ncbi:DNA repair protein RadA [Clostridium sp. BJN0001]|uniref:DNA repair protein RadA n=1 Tax=Clostridium sp. BJN0001 TaxID=2930219 RepID=UPI001FD5BC9D|nr:DNA repair protein RadA [Clostridium sp. BJN0001]
MAKKSTLFVCQNCGYESIKWLGRCPECKEWNTFNEEAIQDNKQDKKLNYDTISNINKPKSIVDIESGDKQRYDTGIEELNRVLGGGLVRGSLTLISGEPGIGKSTILLQTADNIASKYGTVLYVSGEESEEQIKIRGDRLKTMSSELFIVSETNLDIVASHISNINPKFVIVDSVQTMYKETLTSAPGSVSQVKECVNTIMRICKRNNIPIFLVAHVTKNGELAGPRVLEHMVDTVLYFEGERSGEYRILRTMKNRFGTTSEIGVFEMKENGLNEVKDPSAYFIEDVECNKDGSAVIGIMEGTRPILIELQALVTETNMAIPRRTSIGVDNHRLSLILAVLEKKLRIHFFNKDVYVNAVGGMNIDGTAADLGIAVSLISSARNKLFSIDKTIFIGEIGLTGEIRPVPFSERLIKEAVKMGFENVVISKRNAAKLKCSDINIIGVSDIREAVNKIF